MRSASHVGLKCPYCHKPIKASEASVVCNLCGAVHHGDCWVLNGKCTTPACAGESQSLTTAAAERAARPGNVSAVAAMLFALAGLSLLGAIAGIVQLVMPQNEQLALMGITKGDTIPGLVLSLAAVVAYLPMAIGLLQMQPWARTGAMVALAVLFVAETAWSYYFNFTRAIPGLEGFPLDKLPPGAGPAQLAQQVQITIIMAHVSTVLALALRGIMVFLITRPAVVSAFINKETA